MLRTSSGTLNMTVDGMWVINSINLQHRGITAAFIASGRITSSTQQVGNR